MKHISVLVKPASSLCNLRCKYCFYANVSSLREVRSFGRMKSEVASKMIENIFADLEAGDELTLAFQGGEPTLAGLAYFEQIVSFVSDQAKAVTVHYAIQTNGIVINDAWCRFLKEHDFLVGLSIDGHPLYHDLNRLDTKGRGTFHKVMQTKHLFDAHGIAYNVMCVLTDPLAQEAEKVFRFLQEENIEYVQFIPCLDDLDADTGSNYALTPDRFGSFYEQLLPFWIEAFEAGNYISIKQFEDILNLFVGGRTTACGILGNCQIQYVIEADGSVYPCDFYVLDEYRMGYIQEQTLKELFEQDISRIFLCEKPTIPAFCDSCPFRRMCNGGCKRMKDAMYVSGDGNYCGYRALLETFLPEVDHLLRLKGAMIS